MTPSAGNPPSLPFDTISDNIIHQWMHHALTAAYEAIGMTYTWSTASDSGETNDTCISRVELQNQEEEESQALPREVPIGAIFVHQRTHQIIGTAHNTPTRTLNPTNHAEMIILGQIYENATSQQEAENLLKECICVVTIEPCVMCCAALQLAGVTKLVYGAENSKFGGCKGALDVTEWWKPFERIRSGVLKEETLKPLRMFYDNPNTNTFEDDGTPKEHQNHSTTITEQVNAQQREKKKGKKRKRQNNNTGS